MPFYVKLAIVWIFVYVAIWLLRRFPSSRVSRVAFSWHGPVPTPGEYKSRFMFRWSVYALGWLPQIGFLFSCGWFAAWWHPPLAESPLFVAFWAFALPLFGGVALLGAALDAIAALKARLLGPNPAFVMAKHE